MIFFGRQNKKLNSRRKSPNQPGAVVFSYYTSRSENTASTGRKDSEQTTGDRPQVVRILRNLPMYVAILGIVISVGYQLGIESRAQLTLIYPESNELSVARPEAAYSQYISKNLRESIWSKTKLTISTDGLEEKIRAEFPEVIDAAVAINFLDRKPVVKLRISQARLIINSPDGVFVLNSQGKAMLPASQLPNAADALAKLPLVTDETNLGINQGQNVLNSDEVAFITEVYNQLAAKGVQTDSISLPPLAYQLNVKPQGVNYFIKFNMLSNARKAAGSYLAVKAKLESDGKQPKEYVDVRVEDRAYYK